MACGTQTRTQSLMMTRVIMITMTWTNQGIETFIIFRIAMNVQFRKENRKSPGERARDSIWAKSSFLCIRFKVYPPTLKDFANMTIYWTERLLVKGRDTFCDFTFWLWKEKEDDGAITETVQCLESSAVKLLFRILKGKSLVVTVCQVRLIPKTELVYEVCDQL